MLPRSEGVRRGERGERERRGFGGVSGASQICTPISGCL